MSKQRAIPNTNYKWTNDWNNTVVSFPYHLLETTNFLPYKNDAPETISSSFTKTTTKIHKGITFFNVSIIKMETCVALSARGSISLPKFVIKLNFLAINPSNISVKAEMVRNINANR